ncbi:hypothetical protein TIFTF001_035227 [Ficus carica]|uniref:Uncharacterized protein n=1 Tax=Ficus carica TaxID=3494 RepID=A0AA88J9S3_FICCA|nr:hypothetical protein TIFTF001_035227 [Ficus carica]
MPPPYARMKACSSPARYWPGRVDQSRLPYACATCKAIAPALPPSVVAATTILFPAIQLHRNNSSLSKIFRN